MTIGSQLTRELGYIAEAVNCIHVTIVTIPLFGVRLIGVTTVVNFLIVVPRGALEGTYRASSVPPVPI